MNFTIIVPTFNRSKYLQKCLVSLGNQCFLDEYEILVIDNGSLDNTKKIAEQIILMFPNHQIRYIYEPMPGLLSGRHRGALEAKGEILIFVDDDIEADVKWLQAIKESFDDSTVQIVGGRNLPTYQTNPPPWLEWFWSDHTYGKVCGHLSLLDFGEHVRAIDANYVWGLNFSIRKNALFELGGFHPDCIPQHLQHFQGDGETGLTRMANLRGFKAIYQPRAIVYHYIPKERMTYEYFDKRYFYQGVCNSYTSIREAQGQLKKKSWFSQAKTNLQTLKKKILKFKNRVVPQTNAHSAEKHILYERFFQAYQQGYQFHQNSVRQNPELLEWILKVDYWDYKLPKILLQTDQ